MIVDLGHVHYIDAAAVAALLMCEVRLDAVGVQFGVRNAFDEVGRMLAMTRTEHLVRAWDDPESPLGTRA